MKEPKILVIDDDRDYLNDLNLMLSEKYDFNQTDSLSEGGLYLDQRLFDLVILDIHFGGKRSGLDLLRDFREKDKITPVIMITRYKEVDKIVEAMQLGANDYINKPIQYKELQLRIEKTLRDFHLLKENISLKQRLQSKKVPLFGNSAAMIGIQKAVKQIAPFDSSVLITGETGVGKEILARMIHRYSARRDRPFHVINCAAIPDNLIESELFGHEQGAFTGAVRIRKGFLEMADGGTLLIDEIGDMNKELQAKILHVLENQEFYRLGGSELKRTNVRFLFATNRDLKKAMQESSFREDLFYRINVFHIHIPPLRERPEDIADIVHYYLDVYGVLNGKGSLMISPEALELLRSKPWPGNVRQLKNAIERASIFARTDTVSIEDFDFSNEREGTVEQYIDFERSYMEAKDHYLRVFQREYLGYHLGKAGGNISEAARLMDLPRPSLQRMLRELEKTSKKF